LLHERVEATAMAFQFCAGFQYHIEGSSQKFKSF